MSTVETLLSKHKNIVQRASQHELTKQLCQGTLADRTLYVYLLQDLQFFETGLRLICKITSLAPTTHALITLAKKIGFFANDENTYFQDCIKLLKDKAVTDADDPLHQYGSKFLPSVGPYVQFLEEMCEVNKFNYAELITYLWVAEEIYLQWAHNLPKKENLHWKHQTWIDLHDGEHFITWVEFLRDEVNQFKLQEVEAMFIKCVNYEFDFFDGCFKA